MEFLNFLCHKDMGVCLNIDIFGRIFMNFSFNIVDVSNNRNIYNSREIMKS